MNYEINNNFATYRAAILVKKALQVRKYFMKLHLLCFWLFNIGNLFYLLYSHPAAAQILPDTTLPVNTIATPQGNTIIIEGGTTAGANLFHSFQQFSVPTGGEAFFNNVSNIQNIFSRVTGQSISNIDGLIRANGTANLFLINPNGIIFGPNAQLNIGGSFLASTANSIRFTDGMKFSATNPNAASLLTINVPIGLQFTSQQSLTANLQNPGAIVVQGSNLEVQTGKTLALVGGNITIEGSNNPLFRGLVAGGIPIAIVNEIPVPTTPGGRIELGSVTEGDVTLAPTDKGFILGYSGIQNFGDIELRSGATVNTSGIGGGEIQIQARNLQLNSGSRIVSFTLGPISGGDIIVNASESVELLGTGGFIEIIQQSSRPGFSSDNFSNGLYTISFGAGNAGNIVINTSRFSAQNGAFIVTSSTGIGQSGSLNVNASNYVEVDSSALSTAVGPGSIGAAGNITINTRSLLFKNLGLALAGTAGEGVGGNVVVNASELAELIGGKEFLLLGAPVNTGFFTTTLSGANAGNIMITTRKLVVRNRGSIAASTFEKGEGGTININASESMEVLDNGFVSTSTVGAGNGGNLTINTETLVAQDGGQIVSYALSAGNGGNLTVKATKQVQVIGFSTEDNAPSNLAASALPNSIGDGGNLIVETGRLIIQGRTEVTVRSEGKGKAGTLQVNAEEIELSNQAFMKADTQTSGGTIKLQAATITLRDSSITTTAIGGESGGNIDVQGQFLQLRDRSTITTNAYGSNSTGGNINLNLKNGILVALENSDITANAEQSRGGKIAIDAEAIFGAVPRTREELQLLLNTNANSIDPKLLLTSDITAISQQEEPQFQGTVTVNTPDVNPTSGLIELPVDFIDATRLIAQGCPAVKGNSFTVTGRGGLPPLPSEPLRANNTISVDWVISDRQEQRSTNTQVQRTISSTTQENTEIVEATGWIINDKGQVILKAFAPTTANGSWLSPTTCPTSIEAQ